MPSLKNLISTVLTPVALILLGGVVAYDHLATRGPSPAPAPVVVDGKALGRAYAPALASSLADAWLAAADALEKGKSLPETQTAHQITWQAARSRAFAAQVTPGFARVLPEGTEPADPAKRAEVVKLWRDFASGLKGGPLMPFPIPGGWIPDPDEVDRQLATMPRPLFAAAAPELGGSGTGKTTLLYKAFQDVNGGSYIPYPAQTIGDCVSHGFGHGVDLLEAVQIAIGRKAEAFRQTATEAIYGMARVDVGGQRGSYSDGAVGAWAARAVTDLGTVDRETIGPYDGRRAKDWGARGVPTEVRTLAARHKVRSVSLVSTYEELEDALANGYPVPVCSNQGFTLQRDADGFCRPKGTWGHCMLIVGVRGGDRPGACIFQSWGPEMPSGPLGLDQPSNSFWADRDVVASMLRLRDSWALSQFEGYPGQPLPDRWSYGGFA